VRPNIALLLLRRSGINVDIHSWSCFDQVGKWNCFFLCSVFLKKKWKEKKMEKNGQTRRPIKRHIITDKKKEKKKKESKKKKDPSLLVN
jgi:hypothetical protein